MSSRAGLVASERHKRAAAQGGAAERGRERVQSGIQRKLT